RPTCGGTYLRSSGRFPRGRQSSAGTSSKCPFLDASRFRGPAPHTWQSTSPCTAWPSCRASRQALRPSARSYGYSLLDTRDRPVKLFVLLTELPVFSAETFDLID